MQLTDGEDLHYTMLHAPIGICILNADTLIAEIVNDKFLEVAGKPYEDIHDRFYWDALAEARLYYEASLAGVVYTSLIKAPPFLSACHLQNNCRSAP